MCQIFNLSLQMQCRIFNLSLQMHVPNFQFVAANAVLNFQIVAANAVPTRYRAKYLPGTPERCEGKGGRFS
jgi:hypothetical protein